MIDYISQRNADPGNDHRPCLDTSHAIDTLFEVERLDEILEIERAGLLGMTVDGNRPWPWVEVLRVAVRVVLARAELVKIIVSRDVFVAIWRHIGTQFALADVRQTGATSFWYDSAKGSSRQGRCTCNGARTNEIPPPHVVLMACDFSRTDIGRFLDEHRVPRAVQAVSLLNRPILEQFYCSTLDGNE